MFDLLVSDARERSKTFYGFCREWTDFRAFDGPYFRWLCDTLGASEGMTLILLPRGSLKTTMMEHLALWLLIQNPEIQLGIGSQSKTLANKILLKIKRMVGEKAHNGLFFHEVWPEIFWTEPEKESKVWREDALLFRHQEGAVIKKEFTMETFCLDPVPTGSRFTDIILDDAVTDETVATPELIQKTIERFDQLMFVGDHLNRLLVPGTRYDDADLFGKLQGNAMWTVLKRPLVDPALAERYGEEDDRALLFPERFTWDPEKAKAFNKGKKRGVRMVDLKRVRYGTDMSEYIWSCQMLLDPISKGSARYKEEWIREIKYGDGEFLDNFGDREEKGKFHGECFIFVDPAISKKEDACETAITAAVTMGGGIPWVDECRSGVGWSPFETVGRMFEVADKYERMGFTVFMVGIEKVAFQESLDAIFRVEMQARKKFFVLNEEDNIRTNKWVRLDGFAGQVQQKAVRVRASLTKILHQMARYRPRTKALVDCLDATEAVWQLATCRGKRQKSVKSSAGMYAARRYAKFGY